MQQTVLALLVECSPPSPGWLPNHHVHYNKTQHGELGNPGAGWNMTYCTCIIRVEQSATMAKQQCLEVQKDQRVGSRMFIYYKLLLIVNSSLYISCWCQNVIVQFIVFQCPQGKQLVG